MEATLNRIIEENGLNDPYPQQYVRWASNLIRGDWGWSPALQDDVLDALVRRTAVTIEITLFALLLIIPLGLMSGVVAGWRENSGRDNGFRGLAFLSTSIPAFILGLFLLSIFYIGLGWFPIGRSGIYDINLSTSTYQTYTGLLTVDGLLNGRYDVTLDALRRLVLPLITLGLFHWATLGRITRASVIEVKDEDYIRAAHSRGLKPSAVMWRHAFRNAMLPGLTSSALAAAALITGVIVVEAIFDFHGISELITSSLQSTPDAPLALGFAVYSVLLVLPIMLALDIIKAIVDPRIREGITNHG
jgi:peptide/nickel transport system permease protein